MLEYLHIRNLALIDDMSLEFADGMNVLTGETGAGKTFIIKALTFLLGEKLDTSLVRAGAERAQIEALFVLQDEEFVIRRELVAQTGRSRLYINDSLHSQEQLKPLRERLIAYTSQHSQQLLLQTQYQERLFEQLIDAEDLLLERDALLKQLRLLDVRRKELEEKYSLLSDKRELLEMQQEEINKVRPLEDEEEQLENIRFEARSSKIKRDRYNELQQILYGDDTPGLLDLLAACRKILSDFDESENPNLTATLDSAAAFEQQLHYVARNLKVSDAEDNVDLEKIEARLFELAQLKRKLHKSLPDILRMQEEIAENLSFLDRCALDLSSLQKEESQLCGKLKSVIEQITPLRREKAMGFARALEEQLGELGFAKEIRVIPDFVDTKLREDIRDERVHLLWAPNPGQAPQQLDRIASGGELSRFLLALTSLQHHNNSDATLIFDEVDAGVGGLTLNKIARKVHELSEKRQILLITHWPQLAFGAHRHFQVKKMIAEGKTTTQCVLLDESGRHEELARMGGGGAQGQALANSFA